MNKVLVTIPWFYPAFRAGGPIRSIANLVTEIHEDIEFYICCANTDVDGSVLPVETDKWIRYNDHTQVWYTAANKHGQTIIKLAASINPGIIFINGIFSWQYNIVPLLFCKGAHKIVSVRGMLHPGALSQKKLKKKVFLAIWKFFGWHKHISFHATNEEEKKHIEDHFGKADIYIAGNFPKKFAAKHINKQPGTIKLISIALISPMKNHLLVLDAISASPAGIEYHICGAVKDRAYWEKCLQRIKQLPDNIKVEYHGVLPPDAIEGLLDITQVFILPSKSENFGHAFYEALSAGKPVITSHNTPWNNLKEQQAGLNTGLSANEITVAVDFFAGMPQAEFDNWQQGALRYADNAISVESIRQQYKEMFSVQKI